MKFYEITYAYEGKQYSTIEQPIKGWEDDFSQQVLNCIESITRAGGVVINVVGYSK